MTSAARRRVAVLYGGRSGEHEISQQSAASVLAHLDRERFEIVPIAIDKAGRWHAMDLKQLEGHRKALPVEPERDAAVIVPVPDDAALAQATGGPIDVVFPVMHGPLCEDGSLQGLLELADLPYVGAGVLGSAVSMDKDVAKRLVAAAGIPSPPYLAFRAAQWQAERGGVMARVRELSLPVFVKPANLGSSVGIHRVTTEADLAAAVEDALCYDRKVLVERAVRAREIEVAVLEPLDETEPPRTSVPGEIIPQHEFYSYEAKYIDDHGARLAIPAELGDEQRDEAQRLARDIFQLTECEAMARVDLFLDQDSGHFLFNEINTIPGFTTISMYPKLFEASGMSYRELLSHLIELAVARHERRAKLRRSY